MGSLRTMARYPSSPAKNPLDESASDESVAFKSVGGPDIRLHHQLSRQVSPNSDKKSSAGGESDEQEDEACQPSLKQKVFRQAFTYVTNNSGYLQDKSLPILNCSLSDNKDECQSHQLMSAAADGRSRCSPQVEPTGPSRTSASLTLLLGSSFSSSMTVSAVSRTRDPSRSSVPSSSITKHQQDNNLLLLMGFFLVLCLHGMLSTPTLAFGLETADARDATSFEDLINANAQDHHHSRTFHGEQADSSRHESHFEKDPSSFVSVSSPTYFPSFSTFGSWALSPLVYEEPTRFIDADGDPSPDGIKEETATRREDIHHGAISPEKRQYEEPIIVNSEDLVETPANDDGEKPEPAREELINPNGSQPLHVDSVAVESNLEPFIIEAQPVYPGINHLNTDEEVAAEETSPLEKKPQPHQSTPNETPSSKVAHADANNSQEPSAQTSNLTPAAESVESQEPLKPTRGTFIPRKAAESNEIIPSTPLPPPEVVEAAEKKRNELLQRRAKENAKDRANKPQTAEKRAPKTEQTPTPVEETIRKEPITRHKFSFRANETSRSTSFSARVRQGKHLRAAELKEETVAEDNSDNNQPGTEDEDLKKKLAKELAKLYKKELKHRKNQLETKDASDPADDSSAEPVQPAVQVLRPQVSRPTPLTKHRGTAARLARNQTGGARQARKLTGNSTEVPVTASPLWTTTVLPPNVQKFQKLARFTKTKDGIEDNKRRKRLQNIIAPRGRYTRRGNGTSTASSSEKVSPPVRENKFVTAPVLEPIRQQEKTLEPAEDNNDPSLDQKRSCVKVKEGTIVCKVQKKKLGSSRFASEQNQQLGQQQQGFPTVNQVLNNQNKEPERPRFVPKNARRRPVQVQQTLPSAPEPEEPPKVPITHVEVPIVAVDGIPGHDQGDLVVQLPEPPQLHHMQVEHHNQEPETGFHHIGVRPADEHHSHQHPGHDQNGLHVISRPEAPQHHHHHHHHPIHHQPEHVQNELQIISRPEAPQHHHPRPIHHQIQQEVAPPPFHLLLVPQEPPSPEEPPQIVHQTDGPHEHHHQQHQFESNKINSKTPASEVYSVTETEGPPQIYEANYEGWEPLPTPDYHVVQNIPQQSGLSFGHHHQHHQPTLHHHRPPNNAAVPFNHQQQHHRPTSHPHQRPQHHQIHVQHHHRPLPQHHQERPFHGHPPVIPHPPQHRPHPHHHQEPFINRPPQIPYFFPQHPPFPPHGSFFETLVESDEEESVPRETLRPPNFSRPRQTRQKNVDQQSDSTGPPDADVLTPVKEFVQKTPPGGIQPTPDTYYTIPGKEKNQWLEAHLAGKAGSKAVGNDIAEGIPNKQGVGVTYSKRPESDKGRRPVASLVNGHNYTPDYVEPLVIYYEEKTQDATPTSFRKPTSSPYFEPELTQIGADLSATGRPHQQHSIQRPTDNPYYEVPSPTLIPPPQARRPFSKPFDQHGGLEHPLLTVTRRPGTERPEEKEIGGRFKGPYDKRPDFGPPASFIRPSVNYIGRPQEGPFQGTSDGDHNGNNLKTQQQPDSRPHHRDPSENLLAPISPNLRHKGANFPSKHNEFNYEGVENQRPLAIVTSERPFIGNSGETVIPQAVVVLQPAIESGFIQEPYKISEGEYPSKIRFNPEDAHNPGEPQRRPQAQSFRNPLQQETRRPSNYLRPPVPGRDSHQGRPGPFLGGQGGQQHEDDSDPFRNRPFFQQQTTQIPESTTIYAPEGSPHAQSERPPLHIHIEHIPRPTYGQTERPVLVRPEKEEQPTLLLHPGARNPHFEEISPKSPSGRIRPSGNSFARPPSQQQQYDFPQRPDVNQQQEPVNENGFNGPPAPTVNPYVDENPEQIDFHRPNIEHQQEEENFKGPYQQRPAFNQLGPHEEQRPNIPTGPRPQLHPDGKSQRPHKQFGRPSQRPHHQQQQHQVYDLSEGPIEPLGPRRPKARPHPGPERPNLLHPVPIEPRPVETTPASVYFEELPVRDRPDAPQQKRPKFTSGVPDAGRQQQQGSPGQRPNQYSYNGQPIIPVTVSTFQSKPQYTASPTARPNQSKQRQHHQPHPTTYRPAIHNRPIISPQQQQQDTRDEHYTATPAFFSREAATTPLPAAYFGAGHQAATPVPSPTPLGHVIDEASVPYLGIPGTPGKDYPLYGDIPETTFSCTAHQYAGYYADIETGCQAFHFCYNPHKTAQSFLCPNGTLFNQKYFVCDWWYNVKCGESEGYFARNAELFLPFQSSQQHNHRTQEKRPHPSPLAADSGSGTYFGQAHSASSSRNVDKTQHHQVPSLRQQGNQQNADKFIPHIGSNQYQQYQQRESFGPARSLRHAPATQEKGSSLGEDLWGSFDYYAPSFQMSSSVTSPSSIEWWGTKENHGLHPQKDPPTSKEVNTEFESNKDESSRKKPSGKIEIQPK